VAVRSGRESLLGFTLVSYGDVIIDYPGRRYCFIPHKPDVEWKRVQSKYSYAVKDSKLTIVAAWDGILPKQVAGRRQNYNGWQPTPGRIRRMR
jgi:hypothetical protein